MELFASPLSPYVRKVLVMAHETGLIDDITVTEVTTTAMDTDARLASVNPLARIPTLIREDGPALYDSRVILRYLDDRAKAGLYPEGRIWDVLTLEATADGMLDSAVSMVYEIRLRPEDERSPGWIEAQWTKVARGLDVIESRWMSHLHGSFDASHIAVGCALGYIDFRHPGRDWRKNCPSLDAWYGKIADRPSFQLTRPDL